MKPHAARDAQAGFSLMELTVTMGIMVAILGVTAGLMADALRTATVANEVTEAQQSLRAAQEYINRDLIVAGDGLNGLRGIDVRLPLDFVTDNVTPNPNDVRTLSRNGVNTTYVSQPLVASDDAQSRSGSAAGLLPDTDRLTVMTLQPDVSFPVSIVGTTVGVFSSPSANTLAANVSAATAALFRPGEVVLVSSNATGGPAAFAAVSAVTTSGANGQIRFTAGDGYGLNTPNLPLLTDVACGANNVNTQPCNLVTIQRVLLTTYFVDEDGLLRRRVLGRERKGNVGEAEFVAAAMAGDVVAEHITEFQASYGIVTADRSGWQIVDRMTLDQESRVRQVEVKMTAETPHAVLKGDEHASATSVVRTTVRTMEYRNAL